MSRKRKLSTETSFLPQLKCYVNENIQNLRSEKKMKEIYSKKTIFHFRFSTELPLNTSRPSRPHRQPPVQGRQADGQTILHR